MIQTMIIDDEDHIRDSLAKLLSRYCPQVQLIAQANSVESGIRAIHEFKPDLVLLDIQMNDGTGFDILRSFPSAGFKVIFITAYDQYAIKAFRFSAIDYLLKPINPEHLIGAIEHAGSLIHDHSLIQMEALRANMMPVASQERKIILKTSDNIHLLEVKNIVSCESDSCYTTIHTADGLHIMVAKTLKEYEEMLADCGFYRVHKSFLINLNHIRRFDRSDGGYIILSNGLKVPVASRKREEVLGLLEQMAR